MITRFNAPWLTPIAPALLLMALASGHAHGASVETLDGERLTGELTADGIAITSSASAAGTPRVVRWSDALMVTVGGSDWPAAGGVARDKSGERSGSESGSKEEVRPAVPLRRFRNRIVAPTSSANDADAQQSAAVADDNGVFLSDGSWLPGTLSGADQADHVTVSGEWGSFVFPLGAVRSWGRLPVDGASSDEIRLSGGIARGRTSGVKDGALLFESALTPEPVPLTKIITGLMSVANRPLRATSAVLWHQARADRPPLIVVKRETGWAPALAVSGVLPTPPWLRIEGPRRVPLSELTPRSVVETGAFGVVWPWRKDRDLDGQPIRLSGTWLARGVTVHSAATMAWQIKNQYRAFRTQLGIADGMAPEGDCMVTFNGDGAVLARHRVRSGQRPISIDIDVSKITEFQVVIELGERYDIGDHVVLGDAVFIKPARR